MSAARIFLADDHEIVREGIKSLLRSRSDWEICGEATNGADAVTGVTETQPDIAVLDISMPELSGLEAAKKIASTQNDVKIVMFTMHDSKTLVQATREAGASGLVSKSYAARDLVRALDAILEGKYFFDSTVINSPAEIRAS